MTTRLRRRTDEELNEQPERLIDGEGSGGGDPSAEARAEGRRLLHAADQAIRSILSGDSTAYLQSTRQRHGGE